MVFVQGKSHVHVLEASFQMNVVSHSSSSDSTALGTSSLDSGRAPLSVVYPPPPPRLFQIATAIAYSTYCYCFVNVGYRT